LFQFDAVPAFEKEVPGREAEKGIDHQGVKKISFELGLRKPDPQVGREAFKGKKVEKEFPDIEEHPRGPLAGIAREGDPLVFKHGMPFEALRGGNSRKGRSCIVAYPGFDYSGAEAGEDSGSNELLVEAPPRISQHPENPFPRINDLSVRISEGIGRAKVHHSFWNRLV